MDLRPLAALAAALLAGAAAPPQRTIPSTCPDIPACITDLRKTHPSDTAAGIADRLESHGDAAVVVLIPLLRDPDRNFRETVGYTLARFDSIDPRHYPALVDAYRKGGGWLPRAIAATGTDAAMRLFQDEYLADPSIGIHNQVASAIQRFGDRNRAMFEAGLGRCGARAADRQHCLSLVSLLTDFRPVPDWGSTLLAALATAPDTDREVRLRAEDYFIRRVHPIGMAALIRELETRRAVGTSVSDYWLLRNLAAYGEAAAAAGALANDILRTTRDDDTRVEAVSLVAALRYRPAVAEIAALSDQLDADFALAYRAAEALGQIGGPAERPLLERLARDHWHPAVRAMAERALHKLDTGSFERFAGDLALSEAGRLRGLDVAALRYASDPTPRWCTRADRAAAQTFPQSSVAEISRSSGGPAYLAPLPVPAEIVRQVYDGNPAHAGIVVAAPWNDGWLVGTNRGEFGGGLSFRRGDTWRTLIDDNVQMAFRWGGRLYVLTGLAHLGIDDGALWELEPTWLNVRRRIRLPASPSGIALSEKGTLIVRTRRGDLGIAPDGRLVDAAAWSDCAATLAE